MKVRRLMTSWQHGISKRSEMIEVGPRRGSR